MSASAEKPDVEADAEVCVSAEAVERHHVNSSLRISAANDKLESLRNDRA
jgi:hypothetical protein